MVISVFDSRSELLANSKVWVVAHDDNYVIGMMSLEKQSEFLWLNDLFVYCHRRRKGIGRMLVNKAFDCVMKDNCGPESFRRAIGICCGVSPGNEPSLRLFESAGFKWVYTYPDTDSRLLSWTPPF